MALHAVQAPQEVDSCSITTPFLDKSERVLRMEIVTVGGNSGHTHANTFYLEGEMARFVIVLEFIGCGKWVGWTDRDVERA